MGKYWGIVKGFSALDWGKIVHFNRSLPELRFKIKVDFVFFLCLSLLAFLLFCLSFCFVFGNSYLNGVLSRLNPECIYSHIQLITFTLFSRNRLEI